MASAIYIPRQTEKLPAVVAVPSSKSISNRALIFKAFQKEWELKNISKAADTFWLEKALISSESTLWVGHGGTTARFLMAWASVQPKTVTLHGEKRLKERPFEPLITALKALGATIVIKPNQAQFCVTVTGTNHPKNEVTVEMDQSSQFASALALIAPWLPNGLKIQLMNSEKVSESYWNMTIHWMQSLGIEIEQTNSSIKIYPFKEKLKSYTIEPDWSGIQYIAAMVVLNEMSTVVIPNVYEQSIQPDAKVLQLLKPFGLKYAYNAVGIILSYEANHVAHEATIDISQTPDLGPMLFMLYGLKGIACRFIGVSTLYIKESDRVASMRAILAQIGVALIAIGKHELQLEISNLERPSALTVEPCEDHRIAMSGALATFCGMNVTMKNPEVVEKSFPEYWKLFNI